MKRILAFCLAASAAMFSGPVDARQKPAATKVRQAPARKAAKHPGLYPAGRRGRWGFINKTGKIVIPLKYSGAADFSDGLACVVVGGKCGYITPRGGWSSSPGGYLRRAISAKAGW